MVSISAVVDDFVRIDATSELNSIANSFKQRCVFPMLKINLSLHTLSLSLHFTHTHTLVSISWLISRSKIESELLESMTCESLDPLSMQLEAIAHVESVSAERRAHQLDVNYYATKMKGERHLVFVLSIPASPIVCVWS